MINSFAVNIITSLSKLLQNILNKSYGEGHQQSKIIALISSATVEDFIQKTKLGDTI